jgi:hypothetical protein
MLLHRFQALKLVLIDISNLINLFSFLLFSLFPLSYSSNFVASIPISTIYCLLSIFLIVIVGLFLLLLLCIIGFFRSTLLPVIVLFCVFIIFIEVNCLSGCRYFRKIVIVIVIFLSFVHTFCLYSL